jgi:hypothetical protein
VLHPERPTVARTTAVDKSFTSTSVQLDSGDAALRTAWPRDCCAFTSLLRDFC